MLAAPAVGDIVSRNMAALVAVLLAALAFSPLIFLRYDHHDSWAFLYIVNAARVYNFAIGCIETHEHSYLIGRPLYPAAICAMTAFGPVIDLLWVPKLQAFAALLGTGGILAAELRRTGVGLAVACLCVLSLLFLPGTQLMVAHMAANPIALGVLAATVAGYIWVRRLRRLSPTRALRNTWIALAFTLLVLAMALYQIVAVMFFVPVLIALLFAPPSEPRASFRVAVGAVAIFAAAAFAYLCVHHSLLYGLHYFFLVPDQVAGISSTERSASMGADLGHLLAKIRYLGVLLPDISTLWFVSERSRVFLPASAAVAAAVAISGVLLLARRPGGTWRFAAVAIVLLAFFAPYFASDNSGNVAYPQQRVRMFMQLPLVILVWWLVHRLLERRGAWRRAAAGAVMSAVCAGAVVSYLVVLRSYVIPNYMELKHVEPRIQDAIRRDVRHIYLIRATPAHLRAVLGGGNGDELARITTIHNPLHMIAAIVTELVNKRPKRSIIPVAAEKGDTIAPAPDRLILDMRRFP